MRYNSADPTDNRLTTTALIKPNPQAEQIERVLIGGDLGKLNPEERVSYYKMVCESVGLNPLTRPFEYITLNGKLTLYARKDCTDQLRKIHQISIDIKSREVIEGCYIVTAGANMPSSRRDESTGAVTIDGLKGEARANAVMKAETKAKRRVTLSICGLGMLDELEIETVPSAKPPVERTTTDILIEKPVSAALNKEKDGSPVAEGKLVAVDKPPEAAESHSTAVADHPERQATEAGSVEVLHPQANAAVEYISKGEAANFHRECKKAIPAHAKLKQPDLEYTWLYDNKYLNAAGEPSAEMIPKAQWPAAREMCIKWLKVQ